MNSKLCKEHDLPLWLCMECEQPPSNELAGFDSLPNHWVNIEQSIPDRKKDFLRRLKNLQETIDGSTEPLPDWLNGNKHYIQDVDGLTFMMEQSETIYNVVGIWNENGESEPLFL